MSGSVQPGVRIECGDALALLRQEPSESVDCIVTSPPYWGLRDYGVDGQIGLEGTPPEYIARLLEVFREARRVLCEAGTLWLNLGDSYAGSWGAQSRPDGSDERSTLEGSSMLSARQIAAHPKGRTHTGSVKQTPGLKRKDLVGIPWRMAFALQADGWWLRSDIVWSKPNPMPESVTGRPTRAHEYVFLLTKAARYWYDADAIRERATGGACKVPAGWDTGDGPHNKLVGRYSTDKQRGHSRRHAGFNDRWDAMPRAEQMAHGRNARSVWEIAPQPFPEAHFATFPEDLARRCILAGCPEGGTVLDPFGGSGTVGAVAARFNRNAILFELNPAYVEMAKRRVDPEAQPRMDLEAVRP